MAWRGSISRSLMSTVRSSTFRSSSPPLSVPRRLSSPPPLSGPRLLPRRSFSNPRTFAELGCAQSLLPMMGARLAPHLALNVRACCELSNGTFCRSCQDR